MKGAPKPLMVKQDVGLHLNMTGELQDLFSRLVFQWLLGAPGRTARNKDATRSKERWYRQTHSCFRSCKLDAWPRISPSLAPVGWIRDVLKF